MLRASQGRGKLGSPKHGARLIHCVVLRRVVLRRVACLTAASTKRAAQRRGRERRAGSLVVAFGASFAFTSRSQRCCCAVILEQVDPRPDVAALPPGQLAPAFPRVPGRLLLCIVLGTDRVDVNQSVRSVEWPDAAKPITSLRRPVPSSTSYCTRIRRAM